MNFAVKPELVVREGEEAMTLRGADGAGHPNKLEWI
jgi:hypothetical protein